MKEQEEGYVFFRAGCIAAVLIVASFAGCTAHVNYVDDKATQEIIQHGADPIAAFCAIRGGQNKPECVLAANRSAK